MENGKDPIWKHVRLGKALYDKPEDLWKDAVRYFEWVDSNPLKGAISSTKSKHTRKGIDTEELQATGTTTIRPYTFYGLCVFCGIYKWATFKERYYAKQGFEPVIRAIENVITSQQIDNAMVGIFKENLTARLNGLADRTEGGLEIEAGTGQKFNGFNFVPFTEGLPNSETSRIASGEVPMLNEGSTETQEPEPVYAEIIDEDGNRYSE